MEALSQRSRQCRNRAAAFVSFVVDDLSANGVAEGGIHQIKELPRRLSMSRLPAAVFNPLVCHNEVVLLATDFLNRQYVPLGGHLLLDTLEELRAFPSLIETPATPDGLNQTQNGFGREIRARAKRLLGRSRGHY